MKKKFLLSGLMCFLLTTPCFAEDFCVVAGQSSVVDSNGFTRVSIGNPEVADITVFNNKTILLVGKKIGATNLIVWNGDEYETHNVLVSGNNSALATLIKNEISIPSVDVKVIGGKIFLQGEVKNQVDKKIVEDVAGSYGPVVSMITMKIPYQIKIEAKVLEINSSKNSDFGSIFGNMNDGNVSSGVFKFGQSITNSIDGSNFHWFGGYSDINAQVNALVSKGEAKVLSQPYIITLSGNKSNVFVGGQIPVPVMNDGERSVEWKDYGIKLEIEPIVQPNGDINSSVKTEVSSIDRSNGVVDNGLTVPGVSTRTTETRVVMKPGMTMAIGGLISSEEGKAISKLPVLGDIPILGQFFRSTAKSKERKEIVILLTPVMVGSDYKPVVSGEMNRISNLTNKEVLDGKVFETAKDRKKLEKKEKLKSKQIETKLLKENVTKEYNNYSIYDNSEIARERVERFIQSVRNRRNLE